MSIEIYKFILFYIKQKKKNNNYNNFYIFPNQKSIVTIRSDGYNTMIRNLEAFQR